uniref:Uncharacterized protein n=1 Tax=Cucumis melo TaxID=3656 RepID=A0A9I9CEU2_CUCME
MGSPPTQGGGSRNGEVIALQGKPIVWSPLKLRGLKTFRRPSLIPSRPSSRLSFNDNIIFNFLYNGRFFSNISFPSKKAISTVESSQVVCSKLVGCAIL